MSRSLTKRTLQRSALAAWAALSLATASCITTEPAGGRAATAAAPAAPKAAIPPVLFRGGAPRDNTAHDLFVPSQEGLFGTRLAVNRNCALVAAAAQTDFVYVAGDCSSQGRPEGLATAQLRNSNLYFEGVFTNGELTPGLLYRVYELLLSNNMATGTSRLNRAFDCTEVNVLPVTRYGARGREKVLVTSTRSTVCHQFGSGHEGYGFRYARVLRPTADKALLIDDAPRVITSTPGISRHIYADRLEEREGTFFSSQGNNSEIFGRFNIRGSMRVTFDQSRVRYSQQSGSFCVEGSEVCGPLYDTNDLQEGRVVAARKLRLGTFKANDGTVFEAAPDGGGAGVQAYDVWYGVKRPEGAGLLEFGDSIFLRPINGTITYPGGRKYSGRFIDGKPLF